MTVLPSPRRGRPAPANRRAPTRRQRPAARAPRVTPGRHRRRLALLGWKLVVVVGGALLLVVASAMALGFVTVSPQGIGFGSAGPARDAVDGVDGLYPGGPAHRIPVTVDNPGGTSFDITAVRPDFSVLPASCPATAWRASAPDELPTVAARAEATVTLPVALADDAPDGCQALAVRLPVRVDGLRHPTPPSPGAAAPATTAPAATPATGAPPATAAHDRDEALRPGSIDAEAHLGTATLGAPGVTVGVRDGSLAITPVAPTSGPAPGGYEVWSVSTDGARTLVCAPPADRCTDPAAPAAAERRYLVTAHLGTHWRRDSGVAHAWSPPPTPTLAFAGTGGRPDSALIMQAPAAANAYQVQFLADESAFATEQIPAGAAADRLVTVPALSTGSHRIVAVASFHGMRATSAPIGLTASADGSGRRSPAGPAGTGPAGGGPSGAGPAGGTRHDGTRPDGATRDPATTSVPATAGTGGEGGPSGTGGRHPSSSVSHPALPSTTTHPQATTPRPDTGAPRPQDPIVQLPPTSTRPAAPGPEIPRIPG